MAILQDSLGNCDEALRELERAGEENSAVLFMLDVDPRMQNLSKAPGFSRLRNKFFRDVDAGSAASESRVTSINGNRPATSPRTLTGSTPTHPVAS
jgi:hypothetical protein